MVDDTHLIALLVCQIGRRVCALPVDRVGEIMRPLPVVPIPEAPRHIAGMAVIRGQPVPVLDLGRLLDEGATPVRRFVTLRPSRADNTEAEGEGQSAKVAVAVDCVEGIRRIPEGALRAMPSLLHGQAPLLVSAVTPLDTDLLLVLDSMRLVSTLEEAGVAS